MLMNREPKTRTTGTHPVISHPQSVGDVVKFTALAASLAIFVDAAIGHAMIWGNDPYWTYWVTDTLLMATVFGLGTAWFGMGLLKGALITAAHILALTVYYWSLSPIGLPSQPEWLDFEHTWATGLPVHFAVYYLGYVIALWLWRRRFAARDDRAGESRLSLVGEAVLALATAVAVVIIVGLLQTLTLGEFPGVTWFVMRTAVAFPLTLAWWAIAGRDRGAAIGGGVMLGFVLATYSHFLGPIGLPNSSFRLLIENPPPAAVHWLSYRQEFLVLLPLTLAVSVAAYLLAFRWRNGQGVRASHDRDGIGWAPAVIGAVILVPLGAFAAIYTGLDDHRATVTSGGRGGMETGTPYKGDLLPTAASLRMTVENRNTHRTPLPPHDQVDIEATVPAPDGTTYEIRATKPMVDDPQGRFTTWSGVGFSVWHHGRSGIGSTELPPVQSNVAVFALGNISASGRVIAAGVPIHVMTTPRDGNRLELHAGDPNFPLPGIPDGRLRVVWSAYEGGHSRMLSYARYVWGGGVLIVLLGFAVAAARRQAHRSRA
jgi:hypothetical protein